VYELVLKEWYDLLPSMEFRCFVRNRKFLCISQRDSHYYPFLQQIQAEVIRLGTELFGHIQDFELESWVFDMYIPRTRKRAYLIDINPFAPRTDPGLYDWSEVMQMAGDADVEIRLVMDRDRGIGHMEFSAQRVPMDVVNASHGKTVVEFAVKWEELLRNSAQDDRDDSDTE
jgi:D123